MKKRLFFLIALMCCFVLAACVLSACNESGGAGQQTPDGGQPGTETPEQPGGEDPGDEPGEEVIQYRLVYAAASGGSIGGTAAQTVEEKGNGTAVTAVPDDGYEFVRWSDGRTDNPRTDSNVTSDVNVTAEFRLIGNTTDFAGGVGTADHPYEIETIDHLRNMELYPCAHYVLAADIVLPEVAEGESNFTPLFSDKAMFGGTLSGDGHKIVNLAIYNTETLYSGLIACLGASGRIQNIVLENASVSGTGYIGSITGFALGNVNDCFVSGDINVISGHEEILVGGIAGYAEGDVNRCDTDVEITSAYTDEIKESVDRCYVGGIIGYLAYGGSADEPLTLHAKGNISEIRSTQITYIGGIVGYAGTRLFLADCFVQNTITAVNSNASICAGGLVGYSSATTIINKSRTACNLSCFNAGKELYAGGLIGCANGFTQITDSYVTEDLIGGASTGDGKVYVGGFIGYEHSELSVAHSYSTGIVDGLAIEGETFAGGLVGYIGAGFTLQDTHWRYGSNWDYSIVEYAVGYSDSLGIPTSIGSTRHNALEEFYTLADTLNAGREEPVWEHKGEGTLPTLIEKTQENEEETL